MDGVLGAAPLPERVEEGAQVVALVGDVSGLLLQVDPAAERPLAAGAEHDGADLSVLRQRVEAGAQLPHHALADGVDRRPVQADDRHSVAPLELDRLHRAPHSQTTLGEKKSQRVHVVVADRSGEARHVREHLVATADHGDHPEQVAVREAAAVELPALLEVDRRPTVRRELVEVVEQELALVLAPVLDREDGAEVVGDVLRPVAALDRLPVEEARPTRGVEVPVPGVGVAVEHAGVGPLGLDPERGRRGSRRNAARVRTRRRARRRGAPGACRGTRNPAGSPNPRRATRCLRPTPAPTSTRAGGRAASSDSHAVATGKGRCGFMKRPRFATTSSMTMIARLGAVDRHVRASAARAPRCEVRGRGRSGPRRSRRCSACRRGAPSRSSSAPADRRVAAPSPRTATSRPGSSCCRSARP